MANLIEVLDFVDGPKPAAYAKAVAAVQQAFAPDSCRPFAARKRNGKIELSSGIDGYVTQTFRGLADVMPSAGGDYNVVATAPSHAREVRVWIAVLIKFDGTKVSVELTEDTSGSGADPTPQVLWTGRGFGAEAVEAVKHAATVVAHWQKRFAAHEEPQDAPQGAKSSKHAHFTPKEAQKRLESVLRFLPSFLNWLAKGAAVKLLVLYGNRGAPGRAPLSKLEDARGGTAYTFNEVVEVVASCKTGEVARLHINLGTPTIPAALVHSRTTYYDHAGQQVNAPSALAVWLVTQSDAVQQLFAAHPALSAR